MTSFERMSNRMKGDSADKVPNFNIYMTFAARFIKKPLSKYYLDCHTLVNANIAMVENFDADILQAISDPYRETFDFGAEIEFPHDGLPICKKPLLENPENLRKLTVPKPEKGKRMLDRLNAVALMNQKSANEIPVMGWIEGALAEAGNLRGVSNILMDLFERPDWVKELLEKITELEIDFAIQQINAGADIIGLGDAIASQLSPELYKEFALPYEQRIFQAIKNNGGIARLHICGDTSAILSSMVKSKADIIDLDWTVDINRAERIYGKDIVFCGNMDPVSIFLNGSESDVYSATRQTIKNTNSRIISAGGCEIPIGTPFANLHSQNKALLIGK